MSDLLFFNVKLLQDKKVSFSYINRKNEKFR